MTAEASRTLELCKKDADWFVVMQGLFCALEGRVGENRLQKIVYKYDEEWPIR